MMPIKAANCFASEGACIVGPTSIRQELNQDTLTVKLFQSLGELVTGNARNRLMPTRTRRMIPAEGSAISGTEYRILATFTNLA
jgi:hypothetical protein